MRTKADAEPATAVDNGDGTYTITCPDGTSVTLSDGSQGPQGEQGEQEAAGAEEKLLGYGSGDGSYTIECPDGTSITVSEVLMARQERLDKMPSLVLLPPMTPGDVVISCPDGTSVTVPSGTDGQDVSPGTLDNSDGTYPYLP